MLIPKKLVKHTKYAACTDDLYSEDERKVRRAVWQRRAVFWAGRVLHALLLDRHMQSGTFVRKTYVFLYRVFEKNSLREADLQFSLNRFYRFLFFLRELTSCNRHAQVQNQFRFLHKSLQPSTRWRCNAFFRLFNKIARDIYGAVLAWRSIPM